VDAQPPTRGPEAGNPGGQSRRIRLPGFLREEEELGLGEVIKRATSLAGIKPCAGCARRAEALNRWVSFGGREGP
jgi:hypothetical protein